MEKLFLILSILLCQISYAQLDFLEEDEVIKKNTVYVELGGVGKAMYSINYDRILVYADPLTLVVKGGVVFPSSESQDSYKDKHVFPIELTVLAGEEGFIEFGMGQLITPDEKLLSKNSPPYLRCGYRYQNNEGGLMLRLSLVSNLFNEDYKPWLGMGLGYSF